MINTMQRALIRKDVKSITSNKRLFSTLLIVPLVLMILFPTIMVIAIVFAPDQLGDFQQMIEVLPFAQQSGSMTHMVMGVVINMIMPIFFMIVPIMAASVMAASSFVGEKEKRTLETLFYGPLSIKQIFQAKILASALLSMLVSLLSFLAMLVTVELELFLVFGIFVWPSIDWLIIILLVAPGIALIAIAIIVKGSAKAQTMEEAQQKSAFLILPIALVSVGQFSGVLLISTWSLLLGGVILLVIALLLTQTLIKGLDYETILK